ncbi:MAG TPA: ABC-F family ATP-binding cassette domain-containing protein [Candidatus Acidoferrales bacterium]|nr:ABC-F family ATP-binding cassette domain-containing protein [Candidatus Acidoferrales bacterium]
MLSLDNLSKSYGDRKILDGVSWSMNDDGRVGLVGLNGAGKSTLLKLVAEVMPPDGGRIARPQRTRVGYLAQDAPEMGGRSVLRETLAALDRMQALDARRKEVEQILTREHSGPIHDGALEELGNVLTELERHDFYSAESRATSVLFGLGFSADDLSRDVAEFSGGIRMRIALAKLLLDAPEFMMLDEPTNHLDIEARNWLEDFLCAYQGGIILVSHDRYFLDRVTNRTVEVSRGRLTEYVGGYSRYLVAREERFALETAAYEKQREEIEHIESFISRFRYQASKARLVQSRIKQLDKLERLEPPEGSQKPPAITFPKCERSTRRVFELKGAVKRYGALTVYDGVDLTIERGARIALVGPNGSGKSTMMKLLAGIEPMTGGERFVGPSVQAGYFAQNLAESLNYEKTVLDELSDSAAGRSMAELRSILGAMLFSGDDVYKRVGVLSGGERARLALAKVLVHPSNCLLLDEPTNNLDIVAKDTLLDALRRFPGTVIIVSHDRFILNELVTEVLEVGQGHAIRYLGNYDDYLAKKEAMENAAAAPQPAVRSGTPHLRDTRGNSINGKVVRTETIETVAKSTAPKAHHGRDDRDPDRKRERAAKQRKQIEAQIEQKETERAALTAEMDDPNFYLARKDADELIARYERLGREIERLYAELVKFDDTAAISE